MKNRAMRLTVAPTLVALMLFTLVPAQAGVSGAGASLQGLLLDADNRAADGHRILLIDTAGTVVASADVDRDGLYEFGAVETGDYALGIETPEGGMVQVQAPPVRLGENQLARRDVKLMSVDAYREGTPNAGMSAWWGGLSTIAKIWTIVGILVAGGLIYSALDDDDEDEASPI